MKSFSITNRASLFFLSMFALAVMLSHFVFTRYEASFRHHHETLAAQSVRAVASELNLLLVDIKRTSRQFVKYHDDLLEDFYQNPDDIGLYNRIDERLKESYFKHYAFSLADTKGQLLYNDLPARYPAVCRR